MKAEQEIDLGALQNCPIDQLPKVLHAVLDHECGASAPRHEEFKQHWGLADWWGLLQAFHSLMEGWPHSQDCVSVQSLPAAHKKALQDAIAARGDQLQLARLRRTTHVAPTVLSDFDWNLKMSLSNDKLNQVEVPIVTLHLDLQGRQHNGPLCVEMDSKSLASLISSMEAANKVVNQMKTKPLPDV